VNWLEILKVVIALAGAPAVLVIVWSVWLKKVRSALPAWRNGLGLAAMLVLSLNWIASALLELLEHRDTFALADLRWITFQLAHPLDAVAVLLAVALKGEARVGAILAALMMTCWPGGYT
jgi:hypothetical protein